MTRSARISKKEVRLAIALVLAVFALIAVAILKGRWDAEHPKRSDEPRTIGAPQARPIQEGVETRFLVRSVPVLPCDRSPSRDNDKSKDDHDNDPCTVILAMDTASGEREVIPDLELPSELPTSASESASASPTSSIRARVLNGELIAVGSIQRRSRIDETAGKASTRPDAGATYKYGRVLFVRETAPRNAHEAGDKLPLDLAVVQCSHIDALLLGDNADLYVGACRTVHRVSKDGGPLTLLTSGLSEKAFAIDEASVYVATEKNVIRIPKAANPNPHEPKSSSQVAVTRKACARAKRMAIDRDALYCLETDFGLNRGVIVFESRILRVSKDNNNNNIVKSDDAATSATSASLEDDDSNDAGGAIAWSESTRLATVDYDINAITIDGDNIYFGQSTYPKKPWTDAIHAVKKTGGEPPRDVMRLVGGDSIHENFTGLHGLTVVGDELYWANWCVGCPVSSMSTRGGPITDHGSVEGAQAGDIFVFDGTDLYFNAFDGQIVYVPTRAAKKKFPKSSVFSPPQLRGVTGLYVDAKFVYAIRALDDKSAVLVRQAR